MNIGIQYNEFVYIKIHVCFQIRLYIYIRVLPLLITILPVLYMSIIFYPNRFASGLLFGNLYVFLSQIQTPPFMYLLRQSVTAKSYRYIMKLFISCSL